MIWWQEISSPQLCNSYVCDNTEATERIPMESKDDNAQGFPIPLYYCNPLQPRLAYVNHT